MKTGALLVLLAIATLGFAVFPPAFAYVQRVRHAADAHLVCLNPRVSQAMQEAINRNPHGMTAANSYLERRLFLRQDNHFTTLATEAVRARLGGLLAGPRRSASAFCALGNAGGVSENLPNLAFLLGVDDLSQADDCRLAALADIEVSGLSRARKQTDIVQDFAARTKTCPSR